MATIKKELSIKGNTLMKNHECNVLIKPSTSGKIKFYLDGYDDAIVADVDNVSSTSHCVCIGSGNRQVMLIEHFMAACAFCNIDSIDVYIDKPEMPVLDGSPHDGLKRLKRLV